MSYTLTFYLMYRGNLQKVSVLNVYRENIREQNHHFEREMILLDVSGRTESIVRNLPCTEWKWEDTKETVIFSD